MRRGGARLDVHHTRPTLEHGGGDASRRLGMLELGALETIGARRCLHTLDPLLGEGARRRHKQAHRLGDAVLAHADESERARRLRELAHKHAPHGDGRPHDAILLGLLVRLGDEEAVGEEEAVRVRAGHARRRLGRGGRGGDGRMRLLETQRALVHELTLAERERAAGHGRADNVELVFAEHAREHVGDLVGGRRAHRLVARFDRLAESVELGAVVELGVDHVGQLVYTFSLY